MSFWAEWATVAFVGLLAVASPGPNQAMTIRNSLASRRAGIMTATGVALGNAVHAFYCILGIAVVVAQSITLFSLRVETAVQSVALSGMAQAVGYMMAALTPILIGLLHDLTHEWDTALQLMIAIAMLQVTMGYLAGRRLTLPRV